MSAETARRHRWQNAATEPKPRQPLTPAQIATLEQELTQQNEDRQKGKHRLMQATREARAVPGRTKRRLPVTCDTCDDLEVVSRFHGGQTFAQPCPDCNGGEW